MAKGPSSNCRYGTYHFASDAVRSSAEVPSLTMQSQGRDRPDPDALARQLLYSWRNRCVIRRTAWELAAGPAARAMCLSIVRTLLDGPGEIDLSGTVRTWGSRVGSPEKARASLQCLAEAFTSLADTEFGGLPPKVLDPVLEQLALESALPAGRRIPPAHLDGVTGCPDRVALIPDLEAAVSNAVAAGEDVTVAVLEVEDAHSGPHGTAAKVDDAQLLGLLATMRRAFGDRARIYRASRGALAVVATGEATMPLGERILDAKCVDGVKFNWGRASLKRVGVQAVASPDALLLLAEADMAVRRREMTRVTALVTRRRRMTVIGSVAASVVLLSGLSVALLGSPVPPHGTPSALSPHVSVGPGAPVPANWHVPVSPPSSKLVTVHMPRSTTGKGHRSTSTNGSMPTIVLTSHVGPIPPDPDGPTPTHHRKASPAGPNHPSPAPHPAGPHRPRPPRPPKPQHPGHEPLGLGPHHHVRSPQPPHGRHRHDGHGPGGGHGAGRGRGRRN